ncbi:MAG: UDP-N-acetylmuramoyl-L-alanine--D-glutamate ligase [Nitrospirota bacterium]
MIEMDQRSKIAVLGYGVEGKAMLDYLVDHNYDNITVCDENVDIKDKMPDGVSVRLGPEYLDNLMDFEVIFRSPGIRYLEPRLQAAKAAGVGVTSGTAFFMDQAICPVIGVTGTKGKGTTCTLIYEMLKDAGEDVYLGGNIGNPPIEFLDKINAKSVVVLELSSFQLQDLENSPDYAVLLNTTTDHLDYHVDRNEYLSAKESLLAHQNDDSIAVLNKDYNYVEHYEPLVKGDLKYVSVEERVSDGAYVTAAHRHGGTGGAGQVGDEIFYSAGGKEEKICSVSDVALIGSHNLENVLPAIVIAKEFDVENKYIVKVIKEFKGLPHRLELVKEVKGVEYYNDSFSTTAETSMAAVDSFDEPTVLIAGGSGKGLDYSEWATKILTKPSLHTVILIGSTAEQMDQAIIDAEKKLGEAEGSPTKVILRKDLEEAVLEAFVRAEEGGVVVMSPAAASLDQFKNYKYRGRAFREAVAKLR